MADFVTDTTENIKPLTETTNETSNPDTTVPDNETPKNPRIITVQTTSLEENQNDPHSLFFKLLQFLESEDGQQFCYHHCESIAPEKPDNLHSQRSVSMVVNDFHFTVAKNLPVHIKTAVLNDNKSKGNNNFRGRGRGRGGYRNQNNANWVDYAQVRKHYNMQIMRNNYDVQDAKEHVAKQVFRYRKFERQ